MTATTLPLMVALPFLGVALLAYVPNERRALGAAITGGVAGLALLLLATHTPAVLSGAVPSWQMQWMPQLGLALGVRLDGLAWLFAVLVLVIGLLVILYATYYLSKDDPLVRFFQFLLAFMGSMLALVVADNLIALAVFWEMTSLSSFLLIGFWSHRADARFGARQALTITGAGGLALLGGMLLIGHIVGSYELSVVLASGDVITNHPLYPLALGLVLLAAFTKSAQFPFHFWLPHAMAAPTPVSAYLHSATMVKAGVFLLVRFHPALAGTEAWFWTVSLVGLTTLLIGAYLAVFQHDIKGLLAYSTISHLGLITLLLGLDEPLAVVAAIFHIINHATFKASLFMAAGIIDHECGTRDMRRLGGLARAMPVTALLAIIAAGAMAGVPLANGFISKEMFFAETVTLDGRRVMEWVLPLGAGLAGLLGVAYSARFIHDVFFGERTGEVPLTPHEPARFMRAPVELLVLVCLAVGLAPEWLVGTTLATAAGAVLGPVLPDYTLALWHGFNLPLLMSIVALLGGLALYFGLQRFIDLHALVHFPRGGREAFGRALAKGIAGAKRLTLTLESGSLQRYLAMAVTMAIAATALPFALGDGSALSGDRPLTPVNPLAALVWLIAIGAALCTVAMHRQRLLAVILVGAVGLTVALTFVHLSAPDLALTQLLVELVTVILLMLALRWLPQQAPQEASDGLRHGAFALAMLAGAGVAALTWAMLMRQSSSISEYFLQTSKSLGGGSNVVNVILVDFRAFDTLGEVTVLVVAAIVVAGLLTGLEPRERTAPSLPSRDETMLPVVVSALLPFAIVVSVYLFIRGHDLPGGGFIAGLVLAVGLMCQHMAPSDEVQTNRALRRYGKLAGAGLLIALGTGLAAWLFAHPFLTSTYVYWPVPVIGKVPLASAMLFDIGVYLVVIGATMLALLSLARLGHNTQVR